MGIKIEKCLTCGNNPSGISVNPGWYALAECILAKSKPSEALSRLCGLQDISKPRTYTPRVYVAPDKKVNAKVLEIYFSNPTLQNTEIAKMVGRSKTFVSRILLGLGIKRSRWENHKKKGRTKNEEII